MPELLIRIKKKTDGNAALSCLRANGSVTWQRQEGAQGRFFPLHDLTHYAVETVLRHRKGFFGLVADGWNMGDFGTPWPRGPMPADMDPSEQIVGLLDLERTTGVLRTPRDAADPANSVATVILQHVTDAELEAVRARRDELIERWKTLPAGETLELPFDRSGWGAS